MDWNADMDAAPRDGNTEYGWLIEAGDPPHYWDGYSPESYTADSNKAVRFARFQDAEAVRCRLLRAGVHWKSVQHGWG